MMTPPTVLEQIRAEIDALERLLDEDEGIAPAAQPRPHLQLVVDNTRRD